MTTDIFKSFVQHASGGPNTPNDYLSTKIAVMRMFPKLAMGLDSHQMLAHSLYATSGPNSLAQVAKANPAHKGALLGAIKNTVGVPAHGASTGGIMHTLGTPLRAAASGVLHTKLAGLAEHATELAGLGVLARPSINHLRGKEMSEKSKSLHEAAGLGILAAPAAYGIGKHLMTRH